MEETVASLTEAFNKDLQEAINKIDPLVEQFIKDCRFSGEQLAAVGVLRREIGELSRGVWYRMQHLQQEGQRSPRAAEEAAGAR